MDPPPLPQTQPPPAPTFFTTAAAAAAAATTTASAAASATTAAMPATVPPTATNYPDSIDSSPRSRTTESYLDDPQPPQLSSKLRLMCSYGGHIVPRPHDKSLCYIGGDTRIVVVDRHISLLSLSSRLSNTLLNGRSFTLKYQLPSEDLDSLISVTTDEDLDNMIEEYDRTHSTNSSRPSRLRLFLFPLKPDSSQSIGPILESTAKTEDWFLSALNGNTLNRGFSDSASVNCLLGLGDDPVTNLNSNSNSNSNVDLAGSGGGGGGKDLLANKNGKQSGQDVRSVPDSPMLETTSSFGSTSSSPLLANLPPIRVHVEGGGQDQKVTGIEEQFSQISVAGQKQEGEGGSDGGFVVLSSPPPLPVSIMPVASPVMVGVGGAEYQGNNARVMSDDERSDHGAPVGAAYMKQPPSSGQTHQKSGGGGSGGAIDLPSPNSVSSDSSLSYAVNRQKQQLFYQDPVVQIPSGVNRVPSSANPVDPHINTSDPNVRGQFQDSGYVLQPQFDQQQPQQAQQFIHAGTHYIHHHPTGAVPMTTYYPVYPTQQQHHQQHHPQQQHHQQHHPQLDQQYPVYYVQARQNQAYSLPMQQPSISEYVTAIPSSRPQTPPNPSMVPTPASFNPMRNAPITKPETAAMYRTATTAPPQLVQVPSSQHQQQYVGYSQVHHPQQPTAPTSAGAANYAYDLADPAHAQIYYTQPLAPTMTPQYQTMTAGNTVVLPEASAQLPTDNVKQQQQQQVRTSQPI